MVIVSDFLQREYAKHPGSIAVVYVGEIDLHCLMNESAAATGVMISLKRDFIERYNAATRGMKSLDLPDAKTLWDALRKDLEKNKVRFQEFSNEQGLPYVLRELDTTSKGIRFEYDLFPGYTKVHREETILSVMQNIDCVDFAEDHS